MAHANPKRKYGSVCKKHPELRGERYVAHNICVGCNREKAAKITRERPDTRAEYVRRSTWKTKQEVFNHYGGMKCSLCGYDNHDALCLDHIDGGGGVLRKNNTHPWGGYALYVWLKINKYPSSLKFRVLCFNCNALESVARLRIERKSNRNVINKEK